MAAHRLCDELQLFFVPLFLKGNYEFLLHESNKVPYYFPHHLKVMWKVFLLSSCIYLTNISYVHWKTSALIILKHLSMTVLHYSYILVAMRIIDIITLTTVKNWTTAVSYDAIKHIRIEI
jgi:hypothetical protein